MTLEHRITAEEEGSYQPGGVFCHGCLEDKPATEASPDPRYCLGCYDFLKKQAELLDGRKPTWEPKDSQSVTKTPLEPSCKPLQSMTERDKNVGKGNIPTTKMSTVGSKKSGVGKVTVQTETRGRKRQPLPEALIREMHSAGMGSKAIASQLERERGIDISYKTIQRVLSGERGI